MSRLRISSKLIRAAILFCGVCSLAFSQSFLAELQSEHNPIKRSNMALTFADSAFQTAHEFYSKGEFDQGDAQLEYMTKALNACVASLAIARKGRFYKKAEMNVADLQRRMQGLLDDIQLPRRGWAEQTARRLDEIHDKLLEGVMRK